MKICTIWVFVKQLNYLKGVVNIFLVNLIAGVYILNFMQKWTIILKNKEK